MALYTIGDLHLSEDTEKPMDVFGTDWENYTQKIKLGFEKLESGDLCVICGDISWGMNLKNSSKDFMFINNLPGKKIILKGNHDYWWTTATKAKSFLNGLGITSIDFLHNNCFFYNNIAICGTRGWFYEEERKGEHDKKIMLREVGRLESSLKLVDNEVEEKYVFLHYPPIYGSYRCQEILSLFKLYNVKKCFYGHIHGYGRRKAFEGVFEDVSYKLVSADHVGFSPVKVYE